MASHGHPTIPNGLTIRPAFIIGIELLQLQKALLYNTKGRK
ncbi:HMG box domain-containing protein [Psidium guajava]|nr:HMG box domain-containing protein [Psidium guajava]